MSTIKATAHKLAVKNKLLFVFCISFILLSLFLVCYLFFFRSITIDVSKDMAIVYEGESGTASVSITNNSHNFNQRTQEFLDSITYQVSPNKNLSNGSKLTVEANWSSDLADKYNIEVINVVSEVEVQGLVERFDHSDVITQAALDDVVVKVDAYFDRNMDMILSTQFPELLDPTKGLAEKKLIYRVFLQAMDMENKDKIIEIYTLRAMGKNEAEEEIERTIYYMVIIDDINTAANVKEEDVFGEVMDITSLANREELVESLKGKYLLSYTMSVLEESR